MSRYSDDIPYEKRRFWYFTTHGIGPGTIPKDVKLLEVQEGYNKKGTYGDYICLDSILNTDELKEYDLKEEVPPEDRLYLADRVEEYLRNQNYHGIIDDIWEENKELHIKILMGDWKHEHLWLDQLMENFGYSRTEIIEEDNGTDCYDAEHIYNKH